VRVYFIPSIFEFSLQTKLFKIMIIVPTHPKPQYHHCFYNNLFENGMKELGRLGNALGPSNLKIIGLKA
jgi:hypothetical protein